MPDVVAPYPPAPAQVPPDLATPTAGYRLRVIVVLISLFLFAALYLGLIFGAGYFCYWALTPEHIVGPTTHARTQIRNASLTEGNLINKYNDALKQWQDRQIDQQRFLDILEREILPPWRATRQHLMQMKGVPAEEQQIVEMYAKSFQLQEEGWELMARAIRTNNQDLGVQARMKARESEQAARQFGAAAQAYYQRFTPRSNGTSFWIIVGGILCGLLSLFLVKGFFKWRPADKTKRLEVTEKEQPVLFAFIRRLCQETRAPLPHRVFVVHEVNAAVFYHESLLSLFLPARKNLLIGLGLVNQVNLSEFKAVLAHEFGHFSQSSMKVGGYVYMANRVIVDVVFGRDWLDNLVTGLCGTDFRIAIFAWIFVGVLWVLRTTLQGLFRAINFANSALLRQMEFNADLVAVSVTGSDALIYGLCRLDFAGESLGQAWQDLVAAADHGLYSRDLFYHQTRAAEYLRAFRNNPRLGEPPVLPADPYEQVRVFQPDDTSVPKMWATHPSNYEREVNAKRRYIRSPIDERSPWILFQGAEEVRERITQGVYEVAGFKLNGDMPHTQLQPADVVQAFIDTEHAETTYHARYQGVYDHRFLTPGNLNELVHRVPPEFADPVRLAEIHAKLYGESLHTHMEAHRTRQEEFRRLSPLAQGAVKLTGRDFEFRGARYQAADVKRLLDQVKGEMDQDFEWMGGLDREVFLVYHEMARQLDPSCRAELEERYRFHLSLQVIVDNLSAAENNVRVGLSVIAGCPQLDEAQFHGTVATLQGAYDTLYQRLADAGHLRLPVLKNIIAGESLQTLLMTRALLPRLSGDPNCLAGDWVSRFLQQLGDVLIRGRRFHFKSLGGILALQESIAAQWSTCSRSAAGDGIVAGTPATSVSTHIQVDGVRDSACTFSSDSS
jgi:Zn-dependent protease with chaperone function